MSSSRGGGTVAKNVAGARFDGFVRFGRWALKTLILQGNAIASKCHEIALRGLQNLYAPVRSRPAPPIISIT